MENVKFVRSEENCDEMNLYFKICDPLADFVRKNTCYTEKGLTLIKITVIMLHGCNAGNISFHLCF